MMNLYIKKAQNGLILEWTEKNDEGFDEICNEVVEDMDDEHALIQSLLYKVAEHFGVMYDKFKDDNLLIEFTKKGHKLD